MDRTADKSTPLRVPWREALKRAGSFDELRPYLHMGQIQARHGGLLTLPDGKPHSGPGILAPEMVGRRRRRPGRAGDILHRTGGVWLRVVQEQVFAYDRSIELDSVAFDAFFPVAGLPPAEHQEPLTRRPSRGSLHPAPASAAPPVPGGHNDRDRRDHGER